MDNKEEQFEVLDIDENNKEKKMSAFSIVILVIYSMFSLFVLRVCLMSIYYSIVDFEIIGLLITLLIIVALIVPFILLFKSKNNKNLIMIATIYEIMLMVIFVLVFCFIIWPAIKSSITSQWCGINGCM